MPSYRTIADLYLPGDIFVLAGSTLSDSGLAGAVPIPTGWVPAAGAVDPLDAQATQNYWNAGPGAAPSAQPAVVLGPWWSGQHWYAVPIQPAQIYWYRVPNGFALKGAESLGTWPA